MSGFTQNEHVKDSSFQNAQHLLEHTQDSPACHMNKRKCVINHSRITTSLEEPHQMSITILRSMHMCSQARKTHRLATNSCGRCRSTMFLAAPYVRKTDWVAQGLVS